MTNYQEDNKQRRQKMLADIARQIVNRIEQRSAEAKIMTGRGWGETKKNAANLEQWCGAVTGVSAALGKDHPDTNWLSSILVYLIWPRGYSETRSIVAGYDYDRDTETKEKNDAQAQ